MDGELKKMLVQLMEGQEALRLGQEETNKKLAKLEEETSKKLTKLEVGFENFDTRLKRMAEVQEVNYAENQRIHKEIVEMLSDRLDIQDTAIKNNIKAVK